MRTQSGSQLENRSQMKTHSQQFLPKRTEFNYSRVAFERWKRAVPTTTQSLRKASIQPKRATNPRKSKRDRTPPRRRLHRVVMRSTDINETLEVTHVVAQKKTVL